MRKIHQLKQPQIKHQNHFTFLKKIIDYKLFFNFLKYTFRFHSSYAI